MRLPTLTYNLDELTVGELGLERYHSSDIN